MRDSFSSETTGQILPNPLNFTSRFRPRPIDFFRRHPRESAFIACDLSVTVAILMRRRLLMQRGSELFGRHALDYSCPASGGPKRVHAPPWRPNPAAVARSVALRGDSPARDSHTACLFGRLPAIGGARPLTLEGGRLSQLRLHSAGTKPISLRSRVVRWVWVHGGDETRLPFQRPLFRRF